MFGSQILEVIIGLIFVYLLLSLLATTLNEIIMSYLSLRGKDLEKAIRVMLTDEIDHDEKGRKKELETSEPFPIVNTMADKFYDHPLIKKFAKDKSKRPSYISKVNFSKTVIDLLEMNAKLDGQIDDIKKAIQSKLPPGDTKELLLNFVEDTGGNIQKFRANLENWYDEMMDRASGWYKRWVQRFLLMLGMGIGIVFNADTFNIAKKLSSDPVALEKTVAAAVKFKQEYKKNDPSSATVEKKIQTLNARMDTLINVHISESKSVLGMGWDSDFTTLSKFSMSQSYLQWFGLKLLGWAITAIAIALGAPFWFDILNKVVNIRGAGIKPEEKKPSV